MTTSRTTFLSLVAAAVFALTGTAARADHDHFDFDPIEELTAHVQDHSRDLSREVRRQLVGDPQYSHVMADVTAVYRQSARVHALSHARRDPAELCRSARKLDQLVHHLEDTISGLRDGHSHYDHWTRTRVQHGPDLRNIRRLTHMIEDDTHELLDEVQKIERRFSARPTFSRPGAVVTPGGVYVGGRGFSVRLGR